VSKKQVGGCRQQGGVTMTERLHRRFLTVWSQARATQDRGDVPGWVLITIMTAGIVAVLWAFAEPYLTQVLSDSLDETVGR
jgi:hypothetical protein